MRWMYNADPIAIFDKVQIQPQCDVLGNLMVSSTGARATLTDRSGTVGTSASTAASANTERRGFSIQNLGPGVLWFNSLATAVADSPSFKLDVGDYFEAPATGVPTGAISVIASLASTKFTAREW